MDYRQVIDEFTEWAKELAPLEACGLVYLFKGRPRLSMCPNLAENPEQDFAISPVDYAMTASQGEIVGVIHSHPGGPDGPSLKDRSSHIGSGLHWWIVWWLDDGTSGVSFMPSINVEMKLTGRQFVHGVTDCYTLVRDYYQQERGITMPDFQRSDDWWSKGQNLYVEGFPRAGFVEVNGPPEVGDVLLMNVGANVCNHAAIYCGNDRILHHLHGRLSSYELYSGYYRDRTRHVLRYTGGSATGATGREVRQGSPAGS